MGYWKKRDGIVLTFHRNISNIYCIETRVCDVACHESIQSLSKDLITWLNNKPRHAHTHSLTHSNCLLAVTWSHAPDIVRVPVY